MPSGLYEYVFLRSPPKPSSPNSLAFVARSTAFTTRPRGQENFRGGDVVVGAVIGGRAELLRADDARESHRGGIIDPFVLMVFRPNSELWNPGVLTVHGVAE